MVTPGELELDGWAALRQGGPAAAAFYERVLDEEPTMLLPGGLVLDDRAEIVRSMAGAPWDSSSVTDLQETFVVPTVCLVTYAATATRAQDTYSAHISSLYALRQDGWRLTFHQQTPH